MAASKLLRILAAGFARGASDVHLAVGQRPFWRLDGEMMPLAEEPLAEAEMAEALSQILTEEERVRLRQDGSLDFSFTLEERRCRAHAYCMSGSRALALRLLPRDVPPLANLGAPAVLSSLLSARDGLILVGGRTGSGKSTTLAAFLEEMNARRAAHIVTLEDPVEYTFLPKRCFISQRALGRDFPSFPAGLRDALREDPDVIFIGEMREPQTVRIALQAAEAGALVLATLHTKDAAEAVLRIEGMFPGEEQQLRSQLALVLRAVFSQCLLRAAAGGRVLAAEALVAVPAVRSLIRTGKVAQLRGAILAGAAAGMQTMAQAVEALFGARKITREVRDKALANCGGVLVEVPPL